MPNYVSKIKPDGMGGTEYNIKDAELREVVQNMQGEVAGTQTATGNPITITDGSETYAQGLSVELEPKQDLHGYDFPWVGGAGKNKLPMTVANMKERNTTGTWNGNVYSISNGTITVQTDDDGNVTSIKANGTFNANVTFIILYTTQWKSLPSGYYTFSGCPNVSGVVIYFQMANGEIDIPVRSTPESPNYTNNFTNGLNMLSSARNIYISISSGTQLTNAEFKPQIDEGQTATPFAPYSNICPITGYTECEVDVVGDNLMDKDNRVTHIGFAQGETVYVKQNSTTDFSIYLEYSDGTEGSVALIHNVLTTITFTKDVDYLIISTQALNILNNDNADIMVSFTTFTDIVPYHSSNATIQFGQTVYGGRSDFVKGGTSDEFENLDDFTDIIFRGNQVGTNAYEVYIVTPNRKKGVDNLIANEMPVKTTFTDVAEFSIRGFGNDSDIAIKFPKSVVNTSELAKQWCIDNGLQIVYEKATPTTIQTPPTDLKLLQDTNNITTNGTTITLDYIPNNSIGDAVKASEEYTDRAISEKGGVQKTVIFDDLVRIADEITLSLPSSYNFIVFEVNYMHDGATGSAIYSSLIDNINIPANYSGTSHWMELRKAGNIISVRGDADMDQGGALLKITAF